MGGGKVTARANGTISVKVVASRPPYRSRGSLSGADRDLLRPAGQIGEFLVAKINHGKARPNSSASGTYRIIGPRGGQGAERTIVKGDTVRC